MSEPFSMSFQCDGSGWKQLIKQFTKKPHVPRKIKKAYKRKYDELWRLNYEMHTGQRQAAIVDSNGKTTLLPRTFELKRDNCQVSGAWSTK